MPRQFPNEACDACRSTKCFSDFLRNRRQLRNNAQKIIFDYLFAWLAAHQKIIRADMEDAGQFDQQITHDHSIMGTANDKSYDTTHDNLEDDTHQDIHQVSHQDSTPSAVILHLIPHFQLVQKRILRKLGKHIILDRTA